MIPISTASGQAETHNRLLRTIAAWLDPTKRRALVALAIRVAGAGLAYIMQMLLAQWLGLGNYGVFVGIWVWLLVLGGVAPLGLNVQIIGRLATLHDAGEIAAWRGLMLTSVLVAIVMGALVVAGGWTLLAVNPTLFSNDYLLPLWLAVLCVPLIALTEVNEGIARAHGWMLAALAPTYLLRPVLLIGGAFIWMNEVAPLDAAAVLGIAVGACFATVVVQGAMLAGNVWRLIGQGGISAQPLTWILAAVPIILTQTFELLTQNFDMMAVPIFSDRSVLELTSRRLRRSVWSHSSTLLSGLRRRTELRACRLRVILLS